jgi:hypothetical protein
MTKPSHQSAGDLLDRAEGIAPLMLQARRLLELRGTLLRILPEALSRSCTVASARQGKVVLYAENSVIAARLKLLLPTLRNQLFEAGQEVSALVVQVQPPARRAVPPARRALSASAAQSLSALSDRLPDSPLKEAVRALASRSGKPK